MSENLSKAVYKARIHLIVSRPDVIARLAADREDVENDS